MSDGLGQLGSLVISLSADVAAIQSDMGRAAAVVEAQCRKMNDAADMAKKALESIGFGLGAMELKEFVLGTAEVEASLGHLSEKLGISVENLAAYKYAAGQSGTTLESMATSVKKLSTFMVEHSDRLKEAGITAKDANGAMLQLADIFKVMPDGVQKTALAVALFGRGGLDMIPMLNKGSEGIKDMMDKGAALNPVIKEMTEKGLVFNQALADLKTRSEATRIEIFNNLSPVLVQLMKDITALNTPTKESSDKFSFMAEILRTVAVLGGNFAYVWHQIGIEITGIAGQLGALATGNFKLFGAIGEEMKTQAKQAREDIDAWSAKMMAVGKSSAAPGGESGASPAAAAAAAAKANALLGNPDGTRAAVNPLDQYLKQLGQQATGTELDKYAQIIQKGNDIAKDTNQLGRMGEVQAAAYRQQVADSEKAVTSFNAKMDEENRLYRDQTDLLGKSVLERDLDTIAIKKHHEAELLIAEAIKSGRPLTLQAIEDLKAKTEASIAAAQADITARDAAARSWTTGAKSAMNTYIDTVTNAAAQSNALFTNAFKGMEDALVNFVKTGKLDFKTLADSIITDLIRIQVQNKIMGPLVGTSSNPGILSQGLSSLSGGIGNFIGSLFGGGKASGGDVLPGQYYVVGENGPEILVPNTGGTVIPNGGSGSAGGSSQPVNINFNVQAIDSASFRSTLGANRNVIIGVVREAFTRRAITSPI